MARPDVRDVARRYEAAKSARSPHENDWRMAAAYCLPRHFGAWTTDGPARNAVNGAVAARRFAFDNTGVRSLPKYVAILSRLATPRSQRWHILTPSDPALMKYRAVREYFQSLTDLLFKHRNAPRAKFGQTASEVYTSMGVYGTGPAYVGSRRPNPLDRRGGVMYKACSLRDVFILTDDEDNVDTVFRRFYLNARQFLQKWPELRDSPPAVIKQELAKPTPDDNKYVEFVHVVQPRSDYDPDAIDARRHMYVSSYFVVEGGPEYVGEETGYRSMPYVTPRTFTEAGDIYGYSPALQAMPALGGVSAMKKTLLKQGQKAVDPVLLAADDGVLNGGMSLLPGAVNYGAVSRGGQPLVRALETGNFQVGEALIQDERRDIEDSFFVTLFQILTETPEMTATEVIERSAEKAALLAPTMERIQTEYLGPLIEREIDVLDEAGLLAGLEMPPELVEAAGEYEVAYTSPLAKSLYAEETSGYMRALEMAMNYAQVAGDPSPLDHFDLDAALPEIADKMSAPARWMRDPKDVQSIRQQRQQQTQQTQMLENAPALASVAKTAADMGAAK